MRKEIFESEEDLIDVISFICKYDVSVTEIEKLIKEAKIKGYIKKSIVENAEESIRSIKKQTRTQYNCLKYVTINFEHVKNIIKGFEYLKGEKI